jgi:hypothetical protein
MFYTCVFTIIALIYSIDLYKSCYPREYDIILTQILTNIQQNKIIKPYWSLLITVFYNIIYAYSFCQVTLNQTIRFIEPYLQEGIKNIHSRVISDINTNTNTNTNTDTTKTVTIVYSSSEANLIIVRSPAPKNDMIILDKAPESLENVTYETSTPHFLSLYLKIITSDNKETSYNIELSSDKMNFYVVGNVFNSNFFKYYLQNVLNVKIDIDVDIDIDNNNKLFAYTLELMDHNVSMVYLNETQSILINKDGYEILGTNSVIDEEVKDEKIEADEVPKLDASTICY